MKTLVEVATAWTNREYYDKEILREDIMEIDIFTPIVAKDELDETVRSIGDGNSWFEVVDELVHTNKLSRYEYEAFRELVNEIRGDE